MGDLFLVVKGGGDCCDRWHKTLAVIADETEARLYCETRMRRAEAVATVLDGIRVLMAQWEESNVPPEHPKWDSKADDPKRVAHSAWMERYGAERDRLTKAFGVTESEENDSGDRTYWRYERVATELPTE